MDPQPEEESSDEEKGEDDDAYHRKNSSDDEEDEAKKAPEPEVPSGAQKAPDTLTPEKMFSSLFELADTWCPEVDAVQYKEFYEQLAKKLKLPGQGDPKAYDAMLD
jgi:hypothetical protein